MKLFISIVLFSLYTTIRISPLERSEVKSDNIGSNIYNTLVVSQSMKRPNKNWFLNVFALKPSEKYFQNAQYNGLRYQTKLLRENINRNYNDIKNDIYKAKLNAIENRLILLSKFNNNK